MLFLMNFEPKIAVGLFLLICAGCILINTILYPLGKDFLDAFAIFNFPDNSTFRWIIAGIEMLLFISIGLYFIIK